MNFVDETAMRLDDVGHSAEIGVKIGDQLGRRPMLGEPLKSAMSGEQDWRPAVLAAEHRRLFLRQQSIDLALWQVERKGAREAQARAVAAQDPPGEDEAERHGQGGPARNQGCYRPKSKAIVAARVQASAVPPMTSRTERGEARRIAAKVATRVRNQMAIGGGERSRGGGLPAGCCRPRGNQNGSRHQWPRDRVAPALPTCRVREDRSRIGSRSERR